jgi:hypothetical protein
VKGVSFYKEKVMGGVLAVRRRWPWQTGHEMQAIGPRYRSGHRPAVIGPAKVSQAYLRHCCKRISERRARALSPELFEHPAMVDKWRAWPMVGIWGLGRGGGVR